MIFIIISFSVCFHRLLISFNGLIICYFFYVCLQFWIKPKAHFQMLPRYYVCEFLYQILKSPTNLHFRRNNVSFINLSFIFTIQFWIYRFLLCLLDVVSLFWNHDEYIGDVIKIMSLKDYLYEYGFASSESVNNSVSESVYILQAFFYYENNL